MKNNSTQGVEAMTTTEKTAFLKSYGWTIGKRDLRLNTDFAGLFMCVEPYQESELPTRDGSNGPWCVVGNHLSSLVDAAYDFLADGGRE